MHSPLQLITNTSCLLLHVLGCLGMTQLRSRIHLYKVPLTETESLDEIMRTSLTYVKLCIANKRFISYIKNYFSLASWLAPPPDVCFSRSKWPPMMRRSYLLCSEMQTIFSVIDQLSWPAGKTYINYVPYGRHCKDSLHHVVIVLV